MASRPDPKLARLRALVRGRVQGVGFRFFAEDHAGLHGAAGYVRNLRTGEVEVVAEGDRQELEAFLSELRRGPQGAYVTDVLVSWEDPRGEFSDFSVRF
jgi:acylphosphatase